MSEENVEIVRRMYDAWNRRDEEVAVGFTDPEVEYVNSPTAVEPGTRRGINELRAVLRMQWEFAGRPPGHRPNLRPRGGDHRPVARFSSDARRRRLDGGSIPRFVEDPRGESCAGRDTRLWQCRS
jgi:hypothetical protein